MRLAVISETKPGKAHFLWRSPEYMSALHGLRRRDVRHGHVIGNVVEKWQIRLTSHLFTIC